MTSLIATVGLTRVASTITSIISQSVSETMLLFAWGAALLFIGRQLARRSDPAPQEVKVPVRVRSRLSAATAQVEVGV